MGIAFAVGGTAVSTRMDEHSAYILPFYVVKPAVSTRESRSAAYILPVSDGVHRRMRIEETTTQPG